MRIKKCPYCGSENIIRNTKERKPGKYSARDNGLLFAGSAVIPVLTPEWHCNECGRDFGKVNVI